MMRLLAILAIAFAGFPGLVVGVGGGHLHGGACEGMGSLVVEVESTCCGEGDAVVVEVYCPMSKGPCECEMAPDREPRRVPSVPLPSSQQELFTAGGVDPGVVVGWVESEGRSRRERTEWLGLLAGLTHNEVQALLGVWRM